MPDKSTLLKTFNAQFFSFLDDIKTIYPENKEIAKGKKSFEMVKMASPSIIIKIWYSHVYQHYKSEIDSGNVDFFIDKDYSGDLAEVSNADEVIRIIEVIKEPIRMMDEKNKEHTCKYLQVLSKLSELYNAC
jgi:hypothetical protein